MNFRRTWTVVIGDRQRAAPVCRHDLSAQRREKGLRIAVGNRQHRNFQECRRFGECQAFGIFARTNPWRQRITGIHWHVRDRSALHAVSGTKAAFWINIASTITVVLGVRIDDAAHRSVFLRELGLQTAPTAAIARYRNAPFDRNASALESQVVIGHTLIDVDEFGRDIAVGAIDVIGC